MIIKRHLAFALPIVSIIYAITLFSVVQPAKAYITGMRWTTNYTEWRSSFQPGVASDPFPAETHSLIATAANKWGQSNTGKHFNIYDYTHISGPVRVYVTKESFLNQGWAWASGMTRYSSRNGYLQNAQIYLNSVWKWNTSCDIDKNRSKDDVLTVILHEMGHAVQLFHDSAQPDSVMWPDDRCKHDLHTDDINGIGALYN